MIDSDKSEFCGLYQGCGLRRRVGNPKVRTVWFSAVKVLAQVYTIELKKNAPFEMVSYVPPQPRTLLLALGFQLGLRLGLGPEGLGLWLRGGYFHTNAWKAGLSGTPFNQGERDKVLVSGFH